MCTAEHKLRLKQLNAIQLVIADVVGGKKDNSTATVTTAHKEQTLTALNTETQKYTLKKVFATIKRPRQANSNKPEFFVAAEAI